MSGRSQDSNALQGHFPSHNENYVISHGFCGTRHQSTQISETSSHSHIPVEVGSRDPQSLANGKGGQLLTIDSYRMNAVKS